MCPIRPLCSAVVYGAVIETGVGAFLLIWAGLALYSSIEAVTASRAMRKGF